MLSQSLHFFISITCSTQLYQPECHNTESTPLSLLPSSPPSLPLPPSLMLFIILHGGVDKMNSQLTYQNTETQKVYFGQSCN